MKNWIKAFVFSLVCLVAVGEPSPPTGRSFDAGRIASYQRDPDFDYSKDYRESGSLITLFLAYILNLLSRLFTGSGIGWLWPWLWRGLVIAVLLTVLYFILKNRYGVFWVKNEHIFGPLNVVSGIEAHADYARLLTESRERAEYKMAIRYLFLKALNDLGKQGVLKITQWKAPYDYLYELAGERKSALEELIGLFEMTWYGDYEADEQTLEQGLGISERLLK